MTEPRQGGRRPHGNSHGRRPGHRGAAGPGGRDLPQARGARRVEQVRQALGDLLQWQGPADSALSRWLRAHPELGGRDRSEVAEAVYEVLRHLRRYRHLAESGSGPAARRLAILGLAATQEVDAQALGLSEQEADWLQRVRGVSADSLPPAVALSYPDWLYQAMAALPEGESLMAALNQQASLDLRVNPFKAERDVLLGEIQAQGMEVTPTPWSPWGLRVPGRPALNRWSRFLDGSIEVQDEGSQLLALLVAPRRGERIVDFCAGAGGKTLLLGALMRSTGRVYALDVSANRLSRLTPRLVRSGLSNIEPVVIAHENDTRVKRLAGKAHRVLVDAPCSGTGTLRRNPDIKWRLNPDAQAELHALQARILASAARCVAPGGRLVYATCSVLPEENAGQVDAFLATHPEFRRVPVAEILADRSPLVADGPDLALRPDKHGTDGFYAAVMVRQAATPAAEPAVQQPAADEPA